MPALLSKRQGSRGLRQGGAEVSEKHAGVHCQPGRRHNRGCSALMETVREAVFKKTGILLEPEVIRVPY